MNRRPPARVSGFTLIELMIVIAIIGTLAAVAVPKFASLLRKSNEGATKANLGSLRGALSIYYSDLEGQFPGDLGALTLAGKYLTPQMPAVKTPNYHADSNAFLQGAVAASDANGWLYNNVGTSANSGTLTVNCTNTDTKGSVWTVY